MLNMITSYNKAAKDVKGVETLTGYGDAIAAAIREKREQIREKPEDIEKKQDAIKNKDSIYEKLYINNIS
jgi:hypothetical protein